MSSPSLWSSLRYSGSDPPVRSNGTEIRDFEVEIPTHLFNFSANPSDWFILGTVEELQQLSRNETFEATADNRRFLIHTRVGSILIEECTSSTAD